MFQLTVKRNNINCFGLTWTFNIFNVFSNVLPFAHLWKHSCGSKIGLLASKKCYSENSETANFCIAASVSVLETLFLRFPT